MMCKMHTDKQMGQWDRLESLGAGPLVQKHDICQEKN